METKTTNNPQESAGRTSGAERTNGGAQAQPSNGQDTGAEAGEMTAELWRLYYEEQREAERKHKIAQRLEELTEARTRLKEQQPSAVDVEWVLGYLCGDVLNIPQYMKVFERTAMYFAYTYIDSIDRGEAQTNTDVVDVSNGCYFINTFCNAVDDAIHIRHYDYAPDKLM